MLGWEVLLKELRQATVNCGSIRVTEDAPGLAAPFMQDSLLLIQFRLADQGLRYKHE